MNDSKPLLLHSGRTPNILTLFSINKILTSGTFTAEALDFNVFVKQGMTFNGGDVDGPVAMGGNFEMAGSGQMVNQNNGTFTDNGQDVGLVIGGRIYYSSGTGINLLSQANLRLGDLTGSNIYDTQNNTQVNTRISGGGYDSNPRILMDHYQSAASIPFTGSLIDFDSIFSIFKARASAVDALPGTVELFNANGSQLDINSLPNNAQVYIDNLENGINILRLDSTNLNKIQTLVFRNNGYPNSNKQLIISVDAHGVYEWNNFNFSGIGSTEAKYILLNFANVTSLNINNSQTIEGTVFAPCAYVFKNNSANIEGQVIADSYRHKAGEVHYFNYEGDFPDCSTDPGLIGPDNDTCLQIFLYYDPQEIKSLQDASGFGTPEYEWRWSHDSTLGLDNWVRISGATGPSYDPDVIRRTTYYVRLSKVCEDEDFEVSNIVCREVKRKHAAFFTYQNEDCINGDRTVRFEATYIGGNPGQSSNEAQYIWHFPGANDTIGTYVSTQSGYRVTTTYPTPGTYQATLTTIKNDCDSTITLTVQVDDCSGLCDNVTDAGEISGTQASCTLPFSPDSIGGPDALGGSGPLDYVWIYSTDLSLPIEYWSQIPNSNAGTIDPTTLLGPLSQTTYFRRCVQRAGCGSHLESNIIAIEVEENVRTLCIGEEITGIAPIELGGISTYGAGSSYIFDGQSKITTYADGSGRIEAALINVDNPNVIWYASIYTENFLDWLQWSVSKGYYAGQYLSSGAGGPMDHEGWDYAPIDTNQSFLAGYGLVSGDTLRLTDGYIQLGTGANGSTADHGVFGEFIFKGAYAGTGTGQLNLNDCQEVCLPYPKVAAKLALEGPYDSNTGEMNQGLNNQGSIPLEQPFEPYGFTQEISVDSIPSNIADWVLIQIRDKANPTIILYQTVGFVACNGDLVGLDGYSLLQLEVDPREDYYLAIIARGHLGVMTGGIKSRNGNCILHDFRSVSNVYNLSGTNLPMADLGNGIFGLIAGDTDLNGVINSADFNDVTSQYFQLGYMIPDVDFNGVVNSVDFNIIISNYFKISQLPE
ncbi:MAG: choice-of-anchor A family protein [Bacteroidia bacterium]|nr:choice-of-anchor A family protein [Bacteroidia bacterium]